MKLLRAFYSHAIKSVFPRKKPYNRKTGNAFHGEHKNKIGNAYYIILYV